MDINDAELQLTVKSLSITFDSLSKKMSRVKGPQRDEVRTEYDTCDSLLSKLRAEMTKRLDASDD